jgi:uncharacterized protein (DUF736 family)
MIYHIKSHLKKAPDLVVNVISQMVGYCWPDAAAAGQEYTVMAVMGSVDVSRP